MQVRRVADHGSVAGFEPFLEAYPRGQRGDEEFERLLNDGLNIHRHALTEAGAAEPKNSVDQRLGAVGRVQDILDIAPQSTAFLRMLEGKLAVAHDRPQDVIEVVGD